MVARYGETFASDRPVASPEDQSKMTSKKTVI